MDFASALSALATATQIAKDLRDIDVSMEKAELKLKVADLATTLADARMAILDVQEQLATKDRQIADLVGAMAFRANLLEFHGFKYDANAEGNPVGLPYCPRCEAVDGRFIRTAQTIKPGRPFACPQCKSEYAGVSSFGYP
jgi:hypothetical protein